MTQTPSHPVQAARPFADSVVGYSQAGWPCILPVPAAEKHPPPVGFTGAAGRDTTPLDLVTWAGTHGDWSVALRLPDGVIGIDVDEYVKGEVQKNGLATFRAAEERWGPLPPTWSSTARGSSQGPGPSRIMFFRVPPGRYDTKLGPDVEIIQRHHRYAVVAPSSNPQAGGATYRWYDPAGLPSDGVPKPDEFPELPEAWVAGLAEGASSQSAPMAGYADGEQLLGELTADDRLECADVTSAKLRAFDELRSADAGSRHDTMTERTHHLVQLGASGHAGVGPALAELRLLWDALTAGEERGDEFDRMLLTSARKAVSVVGARQVAWDPCSLAQGFAVPAPHPDAPDGEALDAIEPPRWFTPRQYIGVHAFDPRAGTDQTLAEAVLERTWPALRYAYDANTWLLRLPEQWDDRGDLASWAVSEVAPLMPLGNADAEKGSDEHARAQRRSRLLSAAGAGAVATKMRSLVAGGTHPVALPLGELDADPEILWAGGLPWSLRQSGAGSGLVQANVDPATPHIHACGVTPEHRPTPLWDAFLEAVWPDAELRRWAVRVLSICLTGYADRALPILLGETGRGKTQVVTLLMYVLGSYAHAADARLLGAADHAHASIKYALKGRRLSFIDEAPRDSKAGQEQLKQLTGGGSLTANEMRQNPITFRPTHTLVLTANDEPMLTDPAVRSRIRLIPCEGDPELVAQARAAIGSVTGATWRQEAPGVLAAMVLEAAAWLADPSTASTAAAPEAVRWRAEELAAEQDPVRTWLNNETERYEPGTSSRQLYQAFRGSCEQSGIRRDAIPTETKWGRALNRLGYPSSHSHAGKSRQLRVRPLNWHGDGFAPPGDGFDGLVTGSEANPSTTKPQVNHSLSVDGDGFDGLKTFNAYTHTHEEEISGGNRDSNPYPSPDDRKTQPDLRKHPDTDPSANPSDPGLQLQLPVETPKSVRKPTDPAKTEAARQKRAEASEAKRQAAVAEAAGPRLDLPALVLRDGTVRSVTVGQADQLLATVTGSGNALTVDVEHTGFPIGHRDYALRTVQLGNDAFAFDLDPTDPDQADVVRRHLAQAVQLHAHSATADLVPLEVAGLVDGDEAWAKMHDTAIPAQLADPGMTDDNYDLKGLSKAVLGEAAVSPAAEEARSAMFKAGKWLTDVKISTPVERSGWAQVDPHSTTMVRYASSDVLDCAAVARRLPWPRPEILERERRALTAVARVARHGVRIDGEHVNRLLPVHREALADAGGRLQAFGVENPGSDQQVGAAAERLGLALPRTKTGRPSVAKGTLDPYAKLEGDVGDFVRARLDYQKHETALGLFLEPYDLLVRYGDGRARPTVYTLSADTGRMSCVRPNLQQMPREGGFRACITADPGELLVAADFSGVEIRVMAALSQDPSLIGQLAEGVDLHWLIARQVFGPDATKADRYMVKRGVFGWAYGGGVATLAKQVGSDEQTMGRVVDTLAAIAPTYVQWADNLKSSVRAGYTQFPTYSGRVIHLPPAFPHKAPNYAIQGTARELLIDALLRWQETRWGRSVVLPVHDEIVAKVPEDQADEATAALAECMTSEIYGIRIDVESDAPTYAWKDAA